jgi:hypothetical protein
MPRGAADADGAEIAANVPPRPSTAGAAAAYLSTSRREIDMYHRI